MATVLNILLNFFVFASFEITLSKIILFTSPTNSLILMLKISAKSFANLISGAVSPNSHF